jgi:hypothetical protein
VEVSGTGVCPAPRAVASAILQLTSEERRRQLPEQASVRVIDQGDSYEVVVQSERGESARSFDDESRDCERRVRFAAVFAVVTLLPPDILSESPEPTAPAPPLPPPVPPHPSPPPPSPTKPDMEEPLVRLELGGSAEFAPGVADGIRATSFGAELRGLLGRGPLSALLSVAYAPAGRFSVSEVSGELRRLPVAIGARFELDDQPLELAAEAALVGVFERFTGTSLRSPESATTMEFGCRLGLVAGLPIETRVTPFVGASASVFPLRQDIVVAPAGNIGYTSVVWLGAAAGLSFAL